jgi:hypothetical protein
MPRRQASCWLRQHLYRKTRPPTAALARANGSWSQQKRCAAKDRSLSCVTSPVLSAHFVQLRLYRAIEFVVCGDQCVSQLLEPTGTQDD